MEMEMGRSGPPEGARWPVGATHFGFSSKGRAPDCALRHEEATSSSVHRTATSAYTNAREGTTNIA